MWSMRHWKSTDAQFVKQDQNLKKHNCNNRFVDKVSNMVVKPNQMKPHGCFAGIAHIIVVFAFLAFLHNLLQQKNPHPNMV